MHFPHSLNLQAVPSISATVGLRWRGEDWHPIHASGLENLFDSAFDVVDLRLSGWRHSNDPFLLW